ncbi:LysR substrate-binding domain-containing protein [Agrobacterium sp. NPDC090283]|uniref:LysR substrate-binding domain-containing protein n=1 Tax=Agrobacterium sp. NPDC090283 TaxID=3363920 RepID=UPI00383A04E8
MINITVVGQSIPRYSVSMAGHRNSRKSPLESPLQRADLSIANWLLPPLNTLRAFEATCRTGSMRRAADDIGVDHTVISHHNRNLQSWMKCKLLHTGKRGVTLTPEGELFFQKVTQAFELLASATETIRPSSQLTKLQLWCMPGLASRWLTPRLTEIEALFSGIELSLLASAKPTLTANNEPYVIIGYGAPCNHPAHAQVLARPRMFPVASPEWLRRNGCPNSIESMSRRPLIHEEGAQQWLDWFSANGVIPMEKLTGPTLSDATMGLDGAASGQGIALTSDLMAGSLLHDGKLVELFNTETFLGEYYCIAAPRVLRAKYIVNFIGWLKAELAKVSAASAYTLE